ncbi:MAG: helix-turn-helix transcriptional regulator, partial [Thermoleophilia bacterium]|nr:helix-turn-helix transcriptional regulator [Thermoleophilia bacterium]
MSSRMKPTVPAPGLDVPLGPERRRALRMLGDHWTLWLLVAVHELHGARFTDLAAEPGLSRRVLTERLATLVENGLLRTERYSIRPP